MRKGKKELQEVSLTMTPRVITEQVLLEHISGHVKKVTESNQH